MFSLLSTIEFFFNWWTDQAGQGKCTSRALKILCNENEGPVLYNLLRGESCGTPKTRDLPREGKRSSTEGKKNKM